MKEVAGLRSSRFYTKKNWLILVVWWYYVWYKTAYTVERRMYCFQESLPDSRPPPVSFSPPITQRITSCINWPCQVINKCQKIYKCSPKAPPISAPLVPQFTFTTPQSEPRALHMNRICACVNVQLNLWWWKCEDWWGMLNSVRLKLKTHPIHLNIARMSLVKSPLLRPCGTSLLILIASSRF